jgi:hypothetical protein
MQSFIGAKFYVGLQAVSVLRVKMLITGVCCSCTQSTVGEKDSGELRRKKKRDKMVPGTK